MEIYHVADHVTNIVFRLYLLILTSKMYFNCAYRIQLIIHKLTFSIFNLCIEKSSGRDKLMALEL